MMDDIDLEELRRLVGDGADRRLLRALLRQTPSGVLVAEAPIGRVVFANPRIGKIWRMPGAPEPAEWVGYHPDGRRYEAYEWPLARALRGGATVTDEEIEIVRGDGSHGIVRFSAVPIRGDDGVIASALLTCLDVTDQRRRSRSTKFLTDAGALLASSLDYVANLRNIARLAVPAFADWCIVDLIDSSGEIERVAIEHSDPVLATAATRLARRHPLNRETEVGLERVIRTARSERIVDVTPDELARFTKSPEQRRLLGDLGMQSAMIVPLVARGNPLGAITFAVAESGRRYEDDDLEVARELATRAALAIENCRLFDQSRAATEAKSDFLAVMSHELRTPLTAIIGFAELLNLGVPDPATSRQREQAERIEVSARHLLQLIEEILTLVTLESGQRRVYRESVDINTLLRHAVTVIEPMARSKGLLLEVQLAEGDPVLRSDADKLLQILLNLLSNAVKFTEVGGIRLLARAGEDTLVLEVVDSGIGLGPEHVQRIFEPFWQVERPIARRAGGTGLGLTICRRLADLVGAELDVESEVGRGSTFRVTLAR